MTEEFIEDYKDDFDINDDEVIKVMKKELSKIKEIDISAYLSRKNLSILRASKGNYLSQITKSTGVTYVWVTKILRDYSNMGFVVLTKKGKLYAEITEKGSQFLNKADDLYEMINYGRQH